MGNHNDFNDNINNIKASARQNRYDVCVLCLFLTVSWVGLQFVVVAFPDHTQMFLTASSKDTYQPGHPHCMIRVLAVCSQVHVARACADQESFPGAGLTIFVSF